MYIHITICQNILVYAWAWRPISLKQAITLWFKKGHFPNAEYHEINDTLLIHMQCFMTVDILDHVEKTMRYLGERPGGNVSKIHGNRRASVLYIFCFTDTLLLHVKRTTCFPYNMDRKWAIIDNSCNISGMYLLGHLHSNQGNQSHGRLISWKCSPWVEGISFHMSDCHWAFVADLPESGVLSVARWHM